MADSITQLETQGFETLGSAFKHASRHLALKAGVAAITVAALCWSNGASAQSFSYAPVYEQQDTYSSQGTLDDQLPEAMRKRIVSYQSREAPGTIIVDTGNTHLYYVLGNGQAIRYGIGVGRDGFTWSGVQNVTRKAEWPDWVPPAEMIARQPYLPRWVGGGPGNPLGARALYLGSSVYRIHGTNDPSTIGQFVSSGCIRMTNDDVIDLAAKVNIGTKVVVLPKSAAPKFEASRRPVQPNQRLSVSMNLPQRGATNATTGLY